MGILDNIDLNDPQTVGLLSAAAHMFNSSAPSRMPVSLGQVLGQGLSGGLQGYQGAQQAQAKAAQEKQQAEIRDMQLQELRQQNEQRQSAYQQSIERAAALKAANNGFYNQQPNQLSQPSSSPSATGMPQSMPMNQMQPQGSQTDPFSQRMALAQNYRRAGLFDEANAAEKDALQYQPKYAESLQVGVGSDGKLHNYQLSGTAAPKELSLGVKPDMKELNLVGTKQFVDTNSLTPGQSFKVTQSPDSAANMGLQWAKFNNEKDQQGSDSMGFSPAAIANAAARYNIDGTLPPMGMGKSGSEGRKAILNQAAILAQQSGVSADDQRIQQIGNKANTAALSKLQSQQTMVGAFEKNFNKNADLALGLSTQVDNTGVPLVNKWLNAGKRSVAGDPKLSSYDLSIKATANEYAKIISGSMGNTAMAEGEIKKVEGLLNAAQTPQQVAEVINYMKQETQNRMAGFDEEKATLRGSMRTSKTATLDDIAATARSSGKTTAEVTAALRAKGYTIGGQ